MIQLGLVSAILSEKQTDEVISFVAEKGFKCVEMMCWPKGRAERRYAGVTHIEIDNLDDMAIATIREKLEEHKIFISGLGYYPNPLDPDEEKSAFHLDHIKKLIRAASRLGVPVINTFVGRDPQKNIDENLLAFSRKWPDVVRVAEEYNIRIGIENCPMYFTQDEWPGGRNLATTPEIWDRLFNVIPSPLFGLNYDPSHFVWQMMDPIKPVYDYASRLNHIHLKDAKVYPEKLNRVGIMATPLKYHSPRIPGRGDVDWKLFLKALEDIGYNGPACIEAEDKDFEKSGEDIEKAIVLSKDYITGLILKLGETNTP